MKCRFCGAHVTLDLVDLVNAPPSNSYLAEKQLDEPEIFYPLKAMICENCWLVQIAEHKRSIEIFDSTYAYFSSYSSIWLEHARQYVQSMTERLGLGADSLVVEVASNDGYLLQYVRERGIPCLGIEPTASTASVARNKGIETYERFFGVACAQWLVSERGQADLIIANNVLAHVPDINNFVEGLRIALKPGGTVTIEFPHLLNIIRFNQFDTIYHEHYSYLSLSVVRRILAAHGLTVYNVEELPTHGGSLRVFARHSEHDALRILPSVDHIEKQEIEAGLKKADGYIAFQMKANAIRHSTLRFLYDSQAAGKHVVAYGAAAKGNTLLNYCGIKGPELIEYVVDRSPYKQGLFLPGSHIPIVSEARLGETQPDYVLILPWNLRNEIMLQLAYIREWNAAFVVCIPKLEVF